MSVPDRNTANAESVANLTTLQTAADDAFIADASIAIATSITLGKFFVTLTTTKYCNLINLQNYFIGLGYTVHFLDLHTIDGSMLGPAQLFGQFWFDYWMNSGLPIGALNPQRIQIAWKNMNVPLNIP